MPIIQTEFHAVGDHQQAIAVVRLCDVANKNTLTEPFADALCEALAALTENQNIQALILTGINQYFSAGGNLQEMLNAEQGLFAGTAAEITQRYQNKIQRVIQLLYQFPVPTIAAINGAAVGAGLGFALACDLRIATPEAIFAEGFTRIGLIAGDGDAWLLPRVIGYTNAAYLMFTNQKIYAEKALQIGLLNEIASLQDLLPRALVIAKQIATAPRKATIAMKKLLRDGVEQTFDQALSAAATVQGQLHHSEEHKAAVMALLQQLKTS